MRKYFEKQLKENEPIKDKSVLKGRSLYSEYKNGDVIVAFLEQKLGDIEPPFTEPTIIFSLQMIVERELDKLIDDYEFIRMSTIFPVLQKLNSVVVTFQKNKQIGGENYDYNMLYGHIL